MHDEKKKPTQMPNHVGHLQKLRDRKKKTNEAINFMRGYNNK